MSTTETLPAGYKTGTWSIDPVHSDVSFTVRHMMVSKVRGFFRKVEGEITTGERPEDSRVHAEIDLSSIDTNNEQRDAHIQSADFFDVEKYPTMTFDSTEIRGNDEEWTVVGNLNLHGVTLPVELKLEVSGFSPDPYGGYRGGFSATGEISRKDFGIDIQMPMDGGGVVVGDKVQIALEIQAIYSA